ncbi:MAG: tRNA threonylcarbamoyladenosine dehydratase [Polyangiaceae bacterium]
MTDSVRAMAPMHRRYDRLGRLYGEPAWSRLRRAHVMVVGLGGVGSFAVESLARSSIGRLTLVDFDRVCVTNMNRQIQALSQNVAKHKADVLAERVRSIDPQIDVNSEAVFFGPKTADKLLRRSVDYIVDASDNVSAKCFLLSECRERAIRVVTTLGSAGRTDPSAIVQSDLAKTQVCELAHAVRRILRTEYNFPRKGPFGIQAIWSREEARAPLPLPYDGDAGFHCVCPGGKNEHHSCEERSVVRGSVSFVTGSFGLRAAGLVVNAIASGEVPVG